MTLTHPDDRLVPNVILFYLYGGSYSEIDVIEQLKMSEWCFKHGERGEKKLWKASKNVLNQPTNLLRVSMSQSFS